MFLVMNTVATLGFTFGFYFHLDQKIDANTKELSNKIDALNNKIDTKVDALNNKIDTNTKETNEKIDRKFDMLITEIRNNRKWFG
jgi:hypothetical protein